MRQNVLLACILAFLVNSPAYSQEALTNAPDFSHEQVLLATALSNVPFLSYSAVRGFESFSQNPAFSSSEVGQDYLTPMLPIFEPLPIIASDPGRAGLWILGGVSTYSFAQASVLAKAPESLQHTLFLLNWKYGMYTTYETYKEFRSRSSDPDYRAFKQYSFQDVTLAPFSLESYSNPVSMITLPLFIVGQTVGSYVMSGSSNSVFATGRTFIDQTEFNPLLGVTLATGNAALVAIQNTYEESYWRGYVYEEIKYNLKGNWIWATIVTNTLFALWHIPNQGVNWSIVGVFASGALCTWAYELGGVPAAGAAHGLVNATADLADFFLFGGAERKRSIATTESNAKSSSLALRVGAPLTIGFSY